MGQPLPSARLRGMASLRGYIASGYLMGFLWGIVFALFRAKHPAELAWWQIGAGALICGVFMSGPIGAVAGALAGACLRNSEKHSRPAKRLFRR